MVSALWVSKLAMGFKFSQNIEFLVGRLVGRSVPILPLYMSVCLTTDLWEQSNR